MKPSVSLCMIVRNEAQNLVECLQPVKGLVDEIVVVDTGSSDATPAIAARQGASVHSYAWTDDFSAARNETLKHAHGEWIFWLDADDRLDDENRRDLAALLSRLNQEKDPVVYAMRCLSRLAKGSDFGFWVTHTRLFPRNSGLRWWRRVHEQVLLDEGQLGFPVRHTNIVIDHRGYENPAHRNQKLNRDLRLLQLDFALKPDDSVTLFYLGWSHLELGNPANATRFLQRALRQNPRLRKAYTLLAQSLALLRRPAEAVAACVQGLTIYPDDAELLYHQGRILGESHELAGAERCFRELLDRPQPAAYYQVGVEAGLRPKSRFLLGLIYDEQQRYDEAEREYLWALTEAPHYAHAWLGLAQLYLNQNIWTKFSRASAQLANCAEGLPLAKVLWARAHILRGEFAAAHQLLEDAMDMQPQLLWPRLVNSDLLTAEGAGIDELIAAQQSILELDPNERTARSRLDELLRTKNQQVHSSSAVAMEGVPGGAFSDSRP